MEDKRAQFPKLLRVEALLSQMVAATALACQHNFYNVKQNKAFLKPTVYFITALSTVEFVIEAADRCSNFEILAYRRRQAAPVRVELYVR